MNRALKLAAVGLGGYFVYRALKPKYEFRGKHVVITGGSRGLGLVLARQLAHAGARLSICSRDSDELRRAVDDLRQCGVDPVALECDVTDQERVREFLAVARQSNGPVDVLINNAGLIRVGPLEEMRLEDYEEAMRVHFWAALFTSLEVIPEMKSRQKGRILNISSIGGKIAVPHLLPYTGSKFALVGLSHGLRVELARYGITVTTVCPGLMRTGSHIQAEFKGQNEKEYAWFATGGSLPGFSMNVERAARKILAACARGDAEVVLGLPAKLAVAAQGMFPNLTSTLLGLVDHWIMPNPGGIHTASAKGRNSRDWLPEFVTTLSDRAADENNEAASAGVPPPLPAGRH